MPKVNGKTFSYSKEGKKAAKTYARKKNKSIKNGSK